MKLLYSVGIGLYTFGIYLVSPFNRKANLWIKGRKGIFSRIRKIKRNNERVVWFHAASLGEFEQGRPVMEALKEVEPETKILLTFFSPSGYEIRKDYSGADYIFYLPSDTPRNAKRFIQFFKPDAAIFIKYEFWHNYLFQLNKNHIPTYLISAIFRKEQTFFKSWGGFYRNMLRYFSGIFVQDKESVDLLDGLGIKNVYLTGDTRFDRVKQIADSAKKIEKVELFSSGKPVVVCGSTWPADEEILMNYINSHDEYKWIIAPHEIGESHIKNIIQSCSRKVIKYSQPDDKQIIDADVLIIDCIGLLSSVYRYGQIAYIGGGFGAGIHNTLEAAVYGIPVVFGPKYQKFKEAVNLIREGGGFSIKSQEEFNEVTDTLLQNESIRQTAGQQAANYVSSQLGATKTIIEYIRRKG